MPSLTPGELGDLSAEDLTDLERAVLNSLPSRAGRGGGYCVGLRPPWGRAGSTQPRTMAYRSKAALARALLDWAGPDWASRVRV